MTEWWTAAMAGLLRSERRARAVAYTTRREMRHLPVFERPLTARMPARDRRKLDPLPRVSDGAEDWCEHWYESDCEALFWERWHADDFLAPTETLRATVAERMGTRP